MQKHKKTTTKIDNKTFSFEIGKLANQANGVIVSCENTILLCTCVVGKKIETDFLPLSVNYIEKYTATNKIPGGYKKRETASDNETLISRSIDRALRAIIPNDFRNEIQITIQVLSFDGYSCDVLGIAGASLSLNIANVTNKNVAAVRINENLINNYKVIKGSNLLQAICNKKIVMLEFGAQDKVYKKSLLSFKSSATNSIENITDMQNKAYEMAQEIIALQEKTIAYFNKTQNKEEDLIIDKKTKELINSSANDYVNAFEIENIFQRQEKLEEIKSNFLKQYKHEKASLIFHNYCCKEFSNLCFSSKKRLNGRNFEEMREINMEINFLPKLHGSALFSRSHNHSNTQALASCTIGSLSDSQLVESFQELSKDNFLLHYNFLPYCVHETGKNNFVSRREIGHGELAKRAILSVMEEKYNYVIRVVSDITSSDGSSSMATVCATSLALFNAGVPISNHVAGISIGLIEKNNKEKLLVDISGMEDMFGLMDFKVAATKNSIVAMQLDIKNEGINFELCQKAMKLALKNIKVLLKKMEETIKKPNEMLHATYKKMMVIDRSKIKDIIGKNGEVINALCKEFDVKIDADKSGKIYIFGKNLENIENLMQKIKKITS